MSRMDMYMRDMARGRRNYDRASDGRDYRDGRNPYGSRGGYVRDHESDGRDGRNPYGSRGGYVRDHADGRDYDDGRDYYDGRDGARGRRRDYADGRDGHYYPFELSGGFGYDPYMEEMMMHDCSDGRDYRDGRRGRGRDYASEGMLSERELQEWRKQLMKEIEQKDQAFFKEENIEKKAKELGIQFDKFSFDEFMTTVLAMFTDYGKTLGSANMDIYLRLAKDFLCDEDAAARYGQKLSAYYDYIVMGM